jgi:peptidoglycan glycosyltransferase
MQFTREIRYLLLGLLLMFGAVAIVSTYWVIRRDRLLLREDNPRLVEQVLRIQRGGIYDRDGEPLAITETLPSGRVSRKYLHAAMNSAVGYYSVRYGESGAEAAYNSLLTGSSDIGDMETWFEREILHIPQQGIDIQLTLDLAVQQTAYEALGDQKGAVVLVSAQDGAVRALVSSPTFDPNQLDVQWGDLVQDSGEPFFNRALQGNYQPGTSIYGLLVLAALVEQFPVETSFSQASREIDLGDITLSCIIDPPADTLTLFDAFTYGCPAPFADFIDLLGYEAVGEMLKLIRPDVPPTLTGFVNPQQQDQTQMPAVANPVTPLGETFGQGQFRTTPLEMALIVASFINNGNAPAPYILQATRQDQQWDAVREMRSVTPITTPENARRLTALFRQNVVRGTARSAYQEGLDLGGQVGVSYSGERTFTWFVGFGRLETLEGYAIAVILEDSEDLDLAANIGSTVLATALDEISETSANNP